jgi:hypothetical protein
LREFVNQQLGYFARGGDIALKTAGSSNFSTCIQ